MGKFPFSRKFYDMGNFLAFPWIVALLLEYKYMLFIKTFVTCTCCCFLQRLRIEKYTTFVECVVSQ